MNQGAELAVVNRESGFSLVELVGALTIVALTLAVSGTAFLLLNGSGARGMRAIGHQDMVARGLQAMQRDVERMERIVVIAGTTSTGTSSVGVTAEFNFRGDERSLEFVVIEPPVPSDPGPYLVRYVVVGGGTQRKLVRTRMPLQPVASGQRRGLFRDDVTLLEGRFDFRFSYLAGRGESAVWTPTWRVRDSLPGLIRLELRSMSESGLGWPPIVLRPRVDAERDCAAAGAACTLATAGTLRPDAKSSPEIRR